MAPNRTDKAAAALMALGLGAGSVVLSTPRGMAEANVAATTRFAASISVVSAAYQRQMIGVSWRRGCPVAIRDLRIIRMTYWGFDRKPHSGQLMVHRDVAHSVVGAFRRLYDNRFPIRRMRLIEAYRGSDDKSMANDNTSAFNCRPVTGTTNRYSVHSYGRAIDVNPVENPYVRGRTVLPRAGAKFLNRSNVRPGMIVRRSVVVTAFRKGHMGWGGDYRTLEDYQHFERH